MVNIGKILEPIQNLLSNSADQFGEIMINTFGVDPITAIAAIGLTAITIDRVRAGYLKKSVKAVLNNLTPSIVILIATVGFIEYYRFHTGINTFTQQVAYGLVYGVGIVLLFGKGADVIRKIFDP